MASHTRFLTVPELLLSILMAMSFLINTPVNVRLLLQKKFSSVSSPDLDVQSGTVVCSLCLLFAVIIAAIREKLHLSGCSGFPS